MTVSEIFQTETPRLISLFFERLEDFEDENSGCGSVEEHEEEGETPKKEEPELVDGRQLLDHLFLYIYEDVEYAQLNQTLAGYFAKTVGAILNVKGPEVIYTWKAGGLRLHREDGLFRALREEDRLQVARGAVRQVPVDLQPRQGGVPQRLPRAAKADHGSAAQPLRRVRRLRGAF